MIVDLISERPRLNMEASMYVESYDSEIELLRQKGLLFTEFVSMNKDVELGENQSVINYVELKHRKIQEAVDQYWVEFDGTLKKQRFGSDEPPQNDTEDGDIAE